MTNLNDFLVEVEEVMRQVMPFLAGRPREVQGAVLADLLAMWLAGHFSEDTECSHEEARADILATHIDLVKKLIPINEAILLEGVKEKSS